MKSFAIKTPRREFWRTHWLVIVLAVWLGAPALAQSVEGIIVSVVDGDTLLVTDGTGHQRMIDLFGIDAPELRQEFGAQARTVLSALALNQAAVIECREQDRRGRDRCVVFIRGSDLGLAQVRAGMAWWNQFHLLRQTQAEQALYQQAEFNAKIRRLGLWNSKNPQPPWEWRQGRPDE